MASFVENFPFLTSLSGPVSPSVRGAFWSRRASPVAQLVKNLLAVQETLVRCLGWEMYQKTICLDVRDGL